MITICIENLTSHGLKDPQCEYGNNNEVVKKIELIMRYARMMQGKYQTWNRLV